MPKISKVDEVVDQALTVKEAIELLKDMPLKARLIFTADYGNRQHTQQVFPITSFTEVDQNMEPIVESAYSKTGIALEVQDDDDPKPGSKNLVVMVETRP